MTLNESMNMNVLEDDLLDNGLGYEQPRSVRKAVESAYGKQRAGRKPSLSSRQEQQHKRAARRRSSASMGDLSMDFSINMAGFEGKDGVMAAGVAANRPHPSLEYPPLYFFLKRFPGLSKSFKALYK